PVRQRRDHGERGDQQAREVDKNGSDKEASSNRIALLGMLHSERDHHKNETNQHAGRATRERAKTIPIAPSRSPCLSSPSIVLDLLGSESRSSTRMGEVGSNPFLEHCLRPSSGRAMCRSSRPRTHGGKYSKMPSVTVVWKGSRSDPRIRYRLL